MKPAIIKTLLGTAVMLLSILTCSGQNGPSDPLTGKWTKPLDDRTISITILSDLTYEVEFAGDDEVDVYGSCVIDGNQITFNDKGGEYSGNVPGVYEFRLSENSITFTKVNDPLTGRSMLVEGTWSKATEREK